MSNLNSRGKVGQLLDRKAVSESESQVSILAIKSVAMPLKAGVIPETSEV